MPSTVEDFPLSVTFFHESLLFPTLDFLNTQVYKVYPERLVWQAKLSEEKQYFMESTPTSSDRFAKASLEMHTSRRVCLGLAVLPPERSSFAKRENLGIGR